MKSQNVCDLYNKRKNYLQQAMKHLLEKEKTLIFLISQAGDCIMEKIYIYYRHMTELGELLFYIII